MNNETLLLLVFLILLVGVLPTWPYSSAWGYGPTGGLVLVLLVFVIWMIADGRPLHRNASGDIKASVQDAGHDLKAAGRDAADTIRGAVQ